MGAANLNTWCVPVLSESDQNWGEQVSLNIGTVIFKQHFCYNNRQEKPSSSKAEFGIQLDLLLNPQGIYSCLRAGGEFIFKAHTSFPGQSGTGAM